MTSEELLDKLSEIQLMKCETSTLELKAASKGTPKKLFDTLSSFSNQDTGGIIIFGIDENNDFAELGVYDTQDLQKQVNNQCLQMQPVVRPLFTVVEKDGKNFVSAEIPAVDISERPCFYKGVGRIKGSYVRSGDSDELMTEYEIYSYEAYRKKYQDDVRTVERASMKTLDQKALAKYIDLLKEGKPNFADIADDIIYELAGITRDGELTVSAVEIFSPYPQAYFPQMCVIATVIPGIAPGAVGENGQRFIDNKRIEGNIPQMLEDSILFVRKNMRTQTTIDPETGKRTDKTDYPITAVREAVLNALVHRDYSIHSEGRPVQIIMYDDRLEIISPGGIYGRIQVDQLGKVQPDTRNPVLAGALEILKITENRYSGIPTIRRCMAEYELPEPVFDDRRGMFTVTFFRSPNGKAAESASGTIANRADNKNDYYNISNQNNSLKGKKDSAQNISERLIEFCSIPRSRRDICEFLGISSISYAMRVYVDPLIASNQLYMTLPEKPRSSKQRYAAVKE